MHCLLSVSTKEIYLFFHNFSFHEPLKFYNLWARLAFLLFQAPQNTTYSQGPVPNDGGYQ